jgi:ureidoglycolate hydrolase
MKFLTIMANTITIKKLEPQLITPENFKQYGQLITPSNPDKSYDLEDAQLELNQGIPRFYIMRLENRGTRFSKITRHCLCTQCLGAIGGQDWLIAVAPPSAIAIPDLDQLVAFRIPGHSFIKLEIGTWHAGPYFDKEIMDFYNLELSNTNEIDHYSYDFLKNQGIELEIMISN